MAGHVGVTLATFAVGFGVCIHVCVGFGCVYAFMCVCLCKLEESSFSIIYFSLFVLQDYWLTMGNPIFFLSNSWLWKVHVIFQTSPEMRQKLPVHCRGQWCPMREESSPVNVLLSLGHVPGWHCPGTSHCLGTSTVAQTFLGLL